MEKISAVYQIVNTETGDRYVGSSRDVKRRWREHKRPYTWERCPNSPLYQDFQKYGLDKFRFQILAPVIPEYLKQVEQEFIEMLEPTYNNYRANGRDVERQKEYRKKYQKKYRQAGKDKEYQKEYQKKYRNQLCSYNSETLTLGTLYTRLRRAGVEQPTIEVKKYLLQLQ